MCPFNIIVGQGHPNSISILPGLVRPESRGWIKLASADPMAHPLVNPNYLGEASDMEKMVTATKVSREIFATKAFAPWVGKELMPADDPKTDDELRAFLRATADSYHHRPVVQDGHRRPRRGRSGAARRGVAVCGSPTRASCRSSSPGTAMPGS